MKLDMLHEAIGLIDFDLIEESEAAPEKAARVTAFAKPWMKWAVAAVLIIVIGVGTPVALNMMGAFRNENFVSPSGGNDNSGVVTPVDGSEDESGEPDSSSEPASGSSEGEKPQHSDSSEHSSEPPTHSDSSEHSGESENPSGSGQEPASGSSETQDEPGTGGEPGSEGPTSGEFIKDNMPAVTYKINGEYKTFDYQSSTEVVDSGSSYVVDYYKNRHGSTVSKYADAEGFFRYEETEFKPSSGVPPVILSEEEAIKEAENILFNTDITITGLENAGVTVQLIVDKYCVVFSVGKADVEVCLYTTGDFVYIAIL